MTDYKATGFGSVLRSRREKLGLSLDDLAASTRVRKTYLQALEEENLDGLPGKAYAIGFLRIYARQVGLPVEPLLNSFNGIEPGAHDEALESTGTSQSGLPRKVRRKGRSGRWFLLLAFLLLLAAALAYLQWAETKPVKVADSTVSPPPEVQAPPPVPQPLPQPVVALPTEAPPATQGQSQVVATELSVLPAGGAIVRMLPVSAGVLKVSLDNQELREYQLQPEQPLNWKVMVSLACELSAPGLVRVWVEQQEVPVNEYPAFRLIAGPRQDARP